MNAASAATRRIALALLPLLGGGCTGASLPTPTPVSTPLATSDRDAPVLTGGQRFEVRFTAAPPSLAAQTPIELTVTIRSHRSSDAARDKDPPDDTQPVALAVDATMPEHGHGLIVVPIVARTGARDFLVRGLRFHMAGRWLLAFDVTERGVTERATVELVVP